MPKTAATLASLLLVISSIGINIARYPAVSDAVRGVDSPRNSIGRQELFDRPNVASGQSAPATNPLVPQATSNRAILVATDPPMGDAVRSVEPPISLHPTPSDPPSPKATVVAQSEPQGRIIAVRPIVSATPIGDSIVSVSSAGDQDVRRLPPLDDTSSAPIVDEASDVAYPMTRTP